VPHLACSRRRPAALPSPPPTSRCSGAPAGHGD
jgi:hypothetical protein